ncbi:putative pentatricopeptide repeat-containing protein At1g53330 [Asparagus officinalis]|uniref:putative pentatricopeptide repeat-containing protein At1g53330 n=1 Tax=Asparagus officinalis TaxID=4686 RepID=UPI00098E101A|nr:putative pentatricopeptide repeat-containing protein At1g53330 [Asparagus officinalis]
MLERGIEPSIVTFGTLISALCNNSKLDEAFKLKEEMPRLYNIEPNAFVYAALIKALCKSGKLEEALSLRREISGLDSAVYSTLIRALFKAGRKGEVVEILEEMKKACVEPDVVTYNAMIAGFCDDGDLDAALGAMNEMKKEGIKPDVVSYNTVISGFCKKGRAEDAVEGFLPKLRFGKINKYLSNANVFEHIGRIYSIAENHIPQEIDIFSLDTLGNWDINGEWDQPFTVHPKKAPGSGELVVIGADAAKPYLVLGIISADGKKLRHKVDLKLNRSIICHDTSVTNMYNI